MSESLWPAAEDPGAAGLVAADAGPGNVTPARSVAHTRFRRAAVVAIVVAAGYVGNALASGASHMDWGNQPAPYTMTYLGRPLHCLVVEDGAVAGRIGGVTCDFIRYWRGRK